MLTFWIIATAVLAYLIFGLCVAAAVNKHDLPMRDEDGIVTCEQWDLCALLCITLAWPWLAVAEAWDLIAEWREPQVEKDVEA